MSSQHSDSSYFIPRTHPFLQYGPANRIFSWNNDGLTIPSSLVSFHAQIRTQQESLVNFVNGLSSPLTPPSTQHQNISLARYNLRMRAFIREMDAEEASGWREGKDELSRDRRSSGSWDGDRVVVSPELTVLYYVFQGLGALEERMGSTDEAWSGSTRILDRAERSLAGETKRPEREERRRSVCAQSLSFLEDGEEEKRSEADEREALREKLKEKRRRQREENERSQLPSLPPSHSSSRASSFSNSNATSTRQSPSQSRSRDSRIPSLSHSNSTPNGMSTTTSASSSYGNKPFPYTQITSAILDEASRTAEAPHVYVPLDNPHLARKSRLSQLRSEGSIADASPLRMPTSTVTPARSRSAHRPSPLSSSSREVEREMTGLGLSHSQLSCPKHSNSAYRYTYEHGEPVKLSVVSSDNDAADHVPGDDEYRHRDRTRVSGVTGRRRISVVDKREDTRRESFGAEEEVSMTGSGPRTSGRLSFLHRFGKKSRK